MAQETQQTVKNHTQLESHYNSEYPEFSFFHLLLDNREELSKYYKFVHCTTTTPAFPHLVLHHYNSGSTVYIEHDENIDRIYIHGNKAKGAKRAIRNLAISKGITLEDRT